MKEDHRSYRRKFCSCEKEISSFLFATAEVASITAMIFFHLMTFLLILILGLSYGDEQRHGFDRKKVVEFCDKVTRVTEEALGKRSELHGQLVQWLK